MQESGPGARLAAKVPGWRARCGLRVPPSDKLGGQLSRVFDHPVVTYSIAHWRIGQSGLQTARAGDNVRNSYFFPLCNNLQREYCIAAICIFFRFDVARLSDFG